MRYMEDERQALWTQLEVNIRALITRVKTLQVENQALHSRIESLLQKETVQKKGGDSDVDHQKFVNIAGAKWSVSEGEDLKSLIDRYVKEIDKCIELLSE